MRFGRARLLSFDRDPVTGEGTVEVAHEALLGAWPRLRTWIDEARQELRLHRSIGRGGRRVGGCRSRPRLPAGRLPVDSMTTTRRTRHDSEVVLTSSERAFLDASRSAATGGRRRSAERQRHELELEQRSRQRLRTLVAVLAGATLFAVPADRPRGAGRPGHATRATTRRRERFCVAGN
jgi:hypothetical protein